MAELSGEAVCACEQLAVDNDPAADSFGGDSYSKEIVQIRSCAESPLGHYGKVRVVFDPWPSAENVRQLHDDVGVGPLGLVRRCACSVGCIDRPVDHHRKSHDCPRCAIARAADLGHQLGQYMHSRGSSLCEGMATAHSVEQCPGRVDDGDGDGTLRDVHGQGQRFTCSSREYSGRSPYRVRGAGTFILLDKTGRLHLVDDLAKCGSGQSSDASELPSTRGAFPVEVIEDGALQERAECRVSVGRRGHSAKLQ